MKRASSSEKSISQIFIFKLQKDIQVCPSASQLENLKSSAGSSLVRQITAADISGQKTIAFRGEGVILCKSIVKTKNYAKPFREECTAFECIF